MARQVLDFLRAVGGLLRECLRGGVADPRVSDICDIGRVMGARAITDLGEEKELVLLFDREIGVRCVP